MIREIGNRALSEMRSVSVLFAIAIAVALSVYLLVPGRSLSAFLDNVLGALIAAAGIILWRAVARKSK